MCLINDSVDDTTTQLGALTTHILHVYGKIIKQIPLSHLYCGSSVLLFHSQMRCFYTDSVCLGIFIIINCLSTNFVHNYQYIIHM